MSDLYWSFSRHRTFLECKRRYWLNYHAAPLGAKPGATARLLEIYTQKHLISRAQWIGTVVHDAAQDALKALQSGEPLPAGHAAAKALRRANSDIDASEKGMWVDDPKLYPPFQEHYYRAPSRMPWTASLQEIGDLVLALYEHPIFRRICEVPERLQEVEDLVEVELKGTPTRVRLDVLIEDGLGGMAVIDWKTGRTSDEDLLREQLAIYGLYVREIYGASVKGVYANLRTNTWGSFVFSDEDLERTAEFLRASCEAMRAVDPPPELALSSEQEFTMIPEGSRDCRWCRFRRDCGRG